MMHSEKAAKYAAKYRIRKLDHEVFLVEYKTWYGLWRNLLYDGNWAGKWCVKFNTFADAELALLKEIDSITQKRLAKTSSKFYYNQLGVRLY